VNLGFGHLPFYEKNPVIIIRTGKNRKEGGRGPGGPGGPGERGEGGSENADCVPQFGITNWDKCSYFATYNIVRDSW
jgi:hypothetical protein